MKLPSDKNVDLGLENDKEFSILMFSSENIFFDIAQEISTAHSFTLKRFEFYITLH